MDELTIRRNRGTAVVRQQPASRTEKPAESGQAQRTAGTAGFTVSETLQRLMSRISQAEYLSRESRQTLQVGESVLAEVQDRLGRIAELVRESAGEGEPDRDALQAELEQLRESLDQMLRGAVAGGTRLFLEDGGVLEDGLEALLYAVLGEGDAKQEAVQALPSWLLKGMALSSLTPEQLLAGLGLDKSASGAELLAAIRGSSLETSSSAACLAALYLGAVIAGGGSSDGIGPEQALDGLRQLLEKVLEGMTPDQAVETLTNGAFTSLEELQAQFTGGTAPDLQAFLEAMLLSEGSALLLDGSSLLALLAGLESMDLELLMGLLDALQGSGSQLGVLAESPDAQGGGPGPEAAGAGGAERTPADPALAGDRTAVPQGTAGPAALRGTEESAPLSSLRFGSFQVMGRDLSGVSWNAGTLTIGGTADVTVLGGGQETVLVTGSGTVTLQGTDGAAVTVDAPEARIFSAGENTLDRIELREGASLTLDGSGPLRLSGIQAGRSNTLRLAGGAVILPENVGKELPVPLLLDGPASLAGLAGSVRNFSGKPLDPFDLVWKTLLPGWKGITAMELDGRQVRLSLAGGAVPDPARLWMEKGDSQGYHIHHLVIWGRDESGRPRIRYAYLRWDRHSGTFREIGMYPNPFAITGGEQDQDWVYEEESHTLRILSNQVTGISGGTGTDANQIPFSGRIALADHIGKLELTLGGVVCRVASGKAFSLGQENDVTLTLQRGTRNLFKSGAGCAGISLGAGTSLSIGCTGEDGAGLLTATGGTDGAGIGRDSDGGQDQTSHILIRDGVITATGSGGGAGIGAGKRGRMGPITMLGGMVTATGGKSGGAGIGGALGASVGDICIQGGIVTAVATCHAAAIGAGIRGESGDILITGNARIVKALGGNPGADIGACLFGGCGTVRISGSADIGNAKLWTQPGLSLQMGGDTVTLPQFRLSTRALGLDRLSVATRECAQAAQMTVDADRRWVSRIQKAYRALYGRMEQNLCGLDNVQQYIGLVRDTAAADTLLDDMRRSILLQSAQALRTHRRDTRNTEEVKQLLL